MKLHGARAIVSGGASGLGWAVVERFLENGCQVAIFDLPKAESQKKIENLGPNAIFCPVDIADGPQLEKAFETLRKKMSSVQITVNCAGIAFAVKTLIKGAASDFSFFTKTLEVNLAGTFNLCRLAAASMAQNVPDEDGCRGVLINTASIAAFDGQAGQTAYAASKGGIVSMTLPLARDLAAHGIRAVAVAPGIFDTPMLALLPENVRASLAQQVPFPPRLGRPQEFAALIQHIVENNMLNGEVIRLDGALRMGTR